MKNDFFLTVKNSIEELIQTSVYEKVDALLNEKNINYWEIANVLGAFYNSSNTSIEIENICKKVIVLIREYQGSRARTSLSSTTVVFGTSGWREQIGEGFTVLNVHKVVSGIISMLQTPEFLKECKYTTFSAVQNAGVLLIRDNRFMGDEFIDAAAKELTTAGIKVYLGGECPTGVGSAVLTQIQGAGSINFTPSHNSMDYAGLKFNPRDGGPADSTLTTLIEHYSNRLMKEEFQPAAEIVTSLINKIDAAAIFTNFIQTKSQVFNLERICTWLRKNKNDIFILIDNMHGSSRGYIQQILGIDLIDELTKSNSIEFLHTEDDFSFHGVKPEPSATNQKPIIDKLKKVSRPISLGVAMDPDADRIRFADATMDIDMNRFAAIAYANLLDRGITGGIASTVPSSDFALEIAKQNDFPVFEEAVGFKNFRPYLSIGKAIMAFEESDGISFIAHTLEKCAIAGFLAALEILVFTNKNLSNSYALLQKKYGYFYPDKSGEEIKGKSVEEWQSYRKSVGKALEAGLYNKDDILQIGDDKKIIKDINTTDGLKLIFNDRSWILIRSSGTEPKFRYYYEVVSEHIETNIEKKLIDYKEISAAILTQGRNAL